MQRCIVTTATAIATLGSVLMLLAAGNGGAQDAATATHRTVTAATADDPWT
ncbi:hypothetical protein ACFZAG_26535 [Streptomyces sp. NPDC012403]|jgi:hypothetical protein|uniref:hypothetical protein n=1 Tax=unclassified Streptomyces TaxID=2593676 RepID=UPI001C20FD81|nr:hypothetical protein [Streptomyces sp. AC558_RSS880]